MKKSLNNIKKLSIKTLYFNFKYLPFKQAIKFPIFISRNLYIKKAEGSIRLEAPAKTGLIRIGFGDTGIFDDKKSRSIWDVSGEVVFKGKTRVGHGSKISVGETGRLLFGDNFTITAESTIIAYSQVEFGRNCLLSWDILIMDTDLHTIKDNSGTVINPPKAICIGDNVWIGCRCTILKGASIPHGSIVGANSTISKSLDMRQAVYVGNPPKCVRENVFWEM
jgi:acetyltransferase-like isoleucine patch superfamily enzyme